MEYVNRCVKLDLPNGCIVDILEPVLSEIRTWLQNAATTPESSGFLLGYRNRNTGNITICKLTTPQKNDERTRFFCKIQDESHFKVMSYNHQHGIYYMGNWHTHPQIRPVPSSTDIREWNEITCNDTTGCEYAFFIIAGTTEFRIWIGDRKTGSICEVIEAKRVNEIYERG